MALDTECCFAECLFTLSAALYAMCHYVKCRYAECRGAFYNIGPRNCIHETFYHIFIIAQIGLA
jgi:hypothetical protein